MLPKNLSPFRRKQAPLGIIEEDYEARARTIIHSYATAASIWESKVSKIPLVGNFGVMFGSDLQPVSIITAAMIVDLGKMFDHGSAREIVLATTTHFVGTYLGIAFARSLVSFVPFVGNVVNAGLVLHVTEAVGWACYLMYRDDADIADIEDEKSFKPYIMRGLERAEREIGIRKETMERLTQEQRDEHDALVKKLYKNIAGSSRRNILDEIERVVGYWGKSKETPIPIKSSDTK